MLVPVEICKKFNSSKYILRIKMCKIAGIYVCIYSHSYKKPVGYTGGITSS